MYKIWEFIKQNNPFQHNYYLFLINNSLLLFLKNNRCDDDEL
jgi:hypothetical protein